MKKRLFLKIAVGIGLIPYLSLPSLASDSKLIERGLKSEFIESEGWIIKPFDIQSLQTTIKPSNSVLHNIKHTYYNLKQRYKAAKKSFMDPN